MEADSMEADSMEGDSMEADRMEGDYGEFQHFKSYQMDFYDALLPDVYASYVYSPYSIDIIVAMLQNAAPEYYINKSDISNIYFGSLDEKATYNRLFPKKFRKLVFKSDHTVAKISNTIVYQDNGINMDYISKMKEDFYSEIRAVDFKSIDLGQLANDLNKMIENQTNNKIKNLLEPDTFTPETKAVLISCIYFKDNWLEPFKLSEVSDKRVFSFLRDGKIETSDKVEFMDLETRLENYEILNDTIEDIDMECVRLAYKNEAFCMEIFMPSNIKDFTRVREAWGRNPDFFELPWTTNSDNLKITIPKFKIEGDILDVHLVMQFININDIFTTFPGKPALDRLAEDLIVDEIKQKAFIEVNEEGTEAAAATFVTIVRKSVPRFNQITIDKPFYYRIVYRGYYDNDRIVLFMGQVNDITKLN